MLERVQVADVAQVYELWNEYAAAANDGDMERWIALWIDDGIQMPPGAPRRVGREQIRREMQLLFDHFDTRKMIIQPEEVRDQEPFWQVLGHIGEASRWFLEDCR